ncbi:TPA: putative type VI secretion system effector [Stenotrophomonas maltophilia]
MKTEVDVSSEKNSLDIEIGIISDLRVKHVVENVFWREGDPSGIAATGAIAAALGLSGPAAGMAMMSAEEMAEPVTRVEFRLGETQVEGLLWNWPFSEGDRVKIVGSRGDNKKFFALSVLDEDKRLIVSYPHISSGSGAHWIGVLKYTLIFALPSAALFTLSIGVASIDEAPLDWFFLKWLIYTFSGCVFVSCIIGVGIGSRFARYTRMADSIFKSLGWVNGKYINLRRITKLNRSVDDHPALGDTYFRY